MHLIHYITPVRFGAGAIRCLGDELGRLKIGRPLIVTDAGIVRAGVMDRILDVLAGRSHVLFDGTAENPTEANLRAALGLFTGHECDGLIAVGGGSPMDLGKAVALLASQGGEFADYDVRTGGSGKIRRVLPHIAVPTAAGTGAEIGRACIITTDDGRKRVAVNLEMVAHAIICDPELTVTLPPRVTAATGIDALSHGIESYYSPRFNPPAEAITLDGVARIAGHIERATHHGGDAEARAEMMMGALQGGMVLQKGLGGTHAMAHPLGELNLHHGTLIGVLLPHVVAFNASHVPEKTERLSRAVGLGGEDDLAGWMAGLIARLGLPTSLGEMGVDRSLLPDLAAKAEMDHLSATNPRPAHREDYLMLLEKAFDG